jgi:hypothetical protein
VARRTSGLCVVGRVALGVQRRSAVFGAPAAARCSFRTRAAALTGPPFELVTAVAKRLDRRATAAAQRHRPAMRVEDGAVQGHELEVPTHDERTVGIRRDGGRLVSLHLKGLP